MVRVEELRIGNYVYGASDRIEKVCAINSKHKECEVDTENIGILFHNNFNDIFPIPLTEEILLKCGFEYIEETNSFNDEHHMIVKSSDRWLFMPRCTNDDDCYIQFKYVHELQNIFYYNTVFQELNVKL